ncbi:unnamed protein product [Polarella glacialis]|uniref:Pseudouridine synthase RsuA/RluA-like domain-containing protein n=1 Tax=Polarella glacialis TaxID=89957 RepID=A0A813GD49_POLGL|nr:unnamed protein product [Polarella glacialis]
MSLDAARPPSRWVYSYEPGIEAEAAGRMVTKGNMIMRHDLAALPFVLASGNDIVLAPPQRPAFLDSLKKAGFTDLPQFRQDVPEELRKNIGHRPYGRPGEHLRRSNVAKYRSDVVVCRSLPEICEAVDRLGPKVVIKSEFSSSGQGVRWRWDAATEKWAQNRLRQDGAVTVEPWMDIVVELSGEFLNGEWGGVSIVVVEHGIWRGQWLGDPLEKMSQEVYDFVFVERQVELALRALNMPQACGSETCGMDVAIVRLPPEAGGGLEVRYLELNARTNMAHYALGAKRWVPSAQRFDVIRVSDLEDSHIPLTDPENATMWCAVLDMKKEPGKTAGAAFALPPQTPEPKLELKPIDNTSVEKQGEPDVSTGRKKDDTQIVRQAAEVGSSERGGAVLSASQELDDERLQGEHIKSGSGMENRSPHCVEEPRNSNSFPEPLEPAEQWARLPESRLEEVLVTDELLSDACLAFRRTEWSYLYQLLVVALPQFFSRCAARKAVRSGHVQVDGTKVTDENTASPPPGARVMVRVASASRVPQDLARRLQKLNLKSERPEARIRILFQDVDAGWAVVNKPAGMESNPTADSIGTNTLAFQDYLQAVLPPPRFGMHCHSPKVCHRLDFRVSGPMVVATSLDAERALTRSFEEHETRKEYRAIVCGAVGDVGETLVVSAPVDGREAETRVEVLRVVQCPFFGSLSELRLWPVTGRRQQLRRHCAIELGAPIVNEEPALFEAAAPAWARRHGGSALPPAKKRGPGTLFLQAIEVHVPRPMLPSGRKREDAASGTADVVSVRTEVAKHFEELLQNAAFCFAWDRDHCSPEFADYHREKAERTEAYLQAQREDKQSKASVAVKTGKTSTEPRD